MRTATRRLLYALLVSHAIGGVASARDVTRSGGVTARAGGAAIPETAVCPGSLAPSPPRLKVDIVFDGPPMSPKVEASAIAEAAFIWAAYGVDVNTPKGSGCRRDGAVTLTVTLASDHGRQTETAALGSIRFRDDVPEPLIVMYPDAIAALVSVTPFGSVHLHAPTGFRDLIEGRVLGRALAHEIGHFLLRSRQHSPDGLMRALQPAPDLVAVDRHRFRLSADEVTKLTTSVSSGD